VRENDVPRCLAVFRRPVAPAAFLVISLGTLAGGAATATATAATAAQAGAPAVAAWGVAQRIPGLDALEAALGGGIDVNSVSCAAPGDCAAGGDYYDPATDYGQNETAFVASEANGAWSAPVTISIGWMSAPGSSGSVTAVSCASPGNCVAGGYDAEYVEATGFVDTYGAFVIGEVNGVWGRPEQVPGTDALNQQEYALVSSVSCAAPGDCAVAGYVEGYQEFVDDETGGVWATARLVPGYAGAANTGALEFPAGLPVISCAGPGDCVVAGNDSDNTGAEVTSVATETAGTWGSAAPLPGFAASGGAVTSLSCAAPGHCAAGGWTYHGTDQVPFVADQAGGTWRSAEVPGYAGLSHGASGTAPGVAAVSCAAPGDCAAGGTFQAPGNDQGAFVDDEVSGVWRPAEEVPGTKPATGPAGVRGISCAAPGDCGAVIGDSLGHGAYVADETSGAWSPAYPVAGVAGSATTSSISCRAPGACLAGGADHGGNDGYVVAESSSAVTSTAAAPSAATVAYGDEEAEKVAVTVAATWPAPAGTVAVTAGKRAVCVITLKSGKGACAVPAAEFARGKVGLTASYGGGHGFAASSAATSFAVVKADTATMLKLSAPQAPYGEEQQEKLTVRVAPRYAGRASGTVTVRWRGVTACVITLKKGSGTCLLAAKEFKPGTYNLVAAYKGDADFNGSSAEKTLTVSG
jgi:hypothetical protein